jgi:Tol biopolymer transport system component
LVDVKTGVEKLAFEKTMSGFNTFPRTSPDGKWLAYFKDNHWWTYNIQTGQNTNITENIKTDFWNTRDDHPGQQAGSW